MAVLRLDSVQKVLGGRVILREADLTLEPGARVGIVGVNGSGKTTLLNLSAGRLEPDRGVVMRSPDTAYLEQDPIFEGETVADAMAGVLDRQRDLLAEHHRVAELLSQGANPRLEDRLAQLHDRIDRAGGWELEHRVDAILSRVGAPSQKTLLQGLSGGERRRIALARVLLSAPELLVLDEPTNHLDADTVEWLQGTLRNFPGAVLLVTHDRYFLDEVVERIVEVEDGVTVAYEGNYSDYLLSRAERMARLGKVEERRLRLITVEAEWAARKPSAQRKHDHARLARLEKLKAERPLLRVASADFSFSADESLSGTVMETHGLCVQRGGRTLIQNLELSLLRGERLGVIGPNGAGKTTLLKILSGAIPPDSGEVVRGKRSRIAVFSQERAELDPRLTVREAVGGADTPGQTVAEVVVVHGREITLPSWLEQFLFPHDQHQTRLKDLSGGEKARVILARLVRQGANLLLLDEPTNDLDLMTLAVLEQALVNFPGCAVVVTHDRWFLDRVATGVLAFEGEGRVVRYADFAQHRRAMEVRAAEEMVKERAAREAREAVERGQRRPEERKGRMSFKEQKELGGLPLRIEKAEARKAEVEAQLADPQLYKGPVTALRAVQEENTKLEKEIPALYGRWEALEARK